MGTQKNRLNKFFWAPKIYAKNYGQENIYNFMLKIFVYLNLWGLPVTITVTNFEPKKPSFEYLQGLGCLFWKFAAIIHSSALKKCESYKVKS